MSAKTAKIYIRLKSTDRKTLDKCAHDLSKKFESEKLNVLGPIPMITIKKRFSCRRAPNIYKRSFENYELRTHTRIFQISEIKNISKLVFMKSMVFPRTINFCMKLDKKV